MKTFLAIYGITGMLIMLFRILIGEKRKTPSSFVFFGGLAMIVGIILWPIVLAVDIIDAKHASKKQELEQPKE